MDHSGLIIFVSFFIVVIIFLIYKNLPDAKKVRRTIVDEMIDNLKDMLKASNKLKNNDIKEIFTFINEEFDKVSEERNEPKLDGSKK